MRFNPINFDFLTPYKLQSHAQQAVVSAHDMTNTQSISHAPALSRISTNPSAISAKNIVRGIFDPLPFAKRINL